MVPIRSLTIILSTLFSIKGLAQERASVTDYETIGIQGHYGSFITAVPKAFYLKDSYSSLGEISFSKPINHIYVKKIANLPEWGLAIFYGNTGSRNFIGTMGGVFPFINFKLLNTGNFKSSLRTGFGLGFVSKPYNLETNHKDVLIGTSANVFFGALWKNQVTLSNHVSINAGISFSHLSNGNTKLPNLGLNIPAFSTGLEYRINNKKILDLQLTDSTNKGPQINVNVSAGIKQAPWINSGHYITAIIETEIAKQKSAGAKYGAGLALILDPSLRHLYLDTIVTLGNTKKPELNTGPYIFYEKLFGRFSIPIQFGVYIFDSEAGRFFQDIAFRYKINNHLSADAGLLAHWGKVDFLHAGINYSIK